MLKASQTKKETILETATCFFAKKGYKSTDVQDVADSLGMGKGTIYRAFSTKEALFLACCDRAMEKLETFVHDAIVSEGDPIQRIRLGIEMYILFFKKHPELVELFVQERAECKTRQFSTYLAHRAKRNTDWKNLFTELQKEGKVRHVHPDTIIDTITTLLYGIMFTSIFQEDEQSFVEQSKASIDMILYGIFLPDTHKRKTAL